MTGQQAAGIKTKAVSAFLEKVHSAMADLDLDFDKIDEDTLHDWNRVLNMLTDEILAVKEEDTP